MTRLRILPALQRYAEERRSKAGARRPGNAGLSQDRQSLGAGACSLFGYAWIPV